MLILNEDIKQLATLNGLSVSLRTEKPNFWWEVLGRASYVPVMYTSSSVDFQLAYQRGGTMVTKYLEFVLGKSLKQDIQRGTALIMDWLV